jgi:ribosomal protein S18 acetylase RimI-like enzyme
MTIRPVSPRDEEALWKILEPVFRAGETYPVPRDIGREAALSYWLSPGHEVFAAESDGRVAGTYYLRANHPGGGAHVCNCGYITAPAMRGRGIAKAMCLHSLDRARERGFRAMQFNFVIAVNSGAIRLWESCGFKTVGRLPRAFEHPAQGFVDALVMFRDLD